jgi:hypothetical protein
MANPEIKNLLLEGYFIEELPPCFNTLSFSEYIDRKRNFEIWKGFANNLNSDCIHFSIPKQINSRRTLSIPNPLFQVILCQTICDNWGNINNCYNSDLSLTKPIFPMKRSFFNNDIFDKRNEIFIREATNFRFLLKADISRFYSTIYTHAISWAIHGKLPRTEWKKLSYCGNRIDYDVRRCCLDKTHGIPTGPASSYIIHEIIACAVDEALKELFETKSIKKVGLRFIDDYELFFQTEEQAETGLECLNLALREYELELNPIKTSIIKLPVPIEPKWVPYIRNYEIVNAMSQTEILRQKKDIIGYFSRVYEFHKEYSNNNVLLFATKQLLDPKKDVIHRDNWQIFESLLLNSIAYNSTCINTIVQILLSYKAKGYPINVEKIKEAIENLILNTLPSNDYEISWALWSTKVFSISLPSIIGERLSKIENPIIGLLSLDLKNSGNLEGYDETVWSPYLNKDNLYSNKWILAYEVIKKGWMSPSTNYLDDDDFFKELFINDVSFYDGSIIQPRSSLKRFNS